MWVYSPPESKNDAGQCQALSAMFSDGVVPDPIYLACDTPAPFICRKMIVIEGKHGLLVYMYLSICYQKSHPYLSEFSLLHKR